MTSNVIEFNRAPPANPAKRDGLHLCLEKAQRTVIASLKNVAVQSVDEV